MYTYLTLHGAVGVLRFGHPQLCLNRGFRKIYEISFALLRVVPGILITAQIYGFHQSRVESGGALVHFRSGLLGDALFHYNLFYLIVGCLVVVVSNELWKSFNCIKLLIIVVDVVLLTMLGSLDEMYWTIFLGVQVLFCNFGLDVISSRFGISFLEVFMIGMSFFNVFSYRSLGELIEVVMENSAVGQS